LPDNMSKAVILVVINEPEKQHYGSIVAAPAFKKIATKIIDYMNICPKSETGRLIVSLKDQARG
jgi:cell division protein FtsI (penicillin-binding protein 3)